MQRDGSISVVKFVEERREVTAEFSHMSLSLEVSKTLKHCHKIALYTIFCRMSIMQISTQ